MIVHTRRAYRTEPTRVLVVQSLLVPIQAILSYPILSYPLLSSPLRPSITHIHLQSSQPDVSISISISISTLHLSRANHLSTRLQLQAPKPELLNFLERHLRITLKILSAIPPPDIAFAPHEMDES
jgi:hypothetical protein